MRVVLSIFLVGGLVITAAWFLGAQPPPPVTAPAPAITPAPGCRLGGGSTTVPEPTKILTRRVDAAWTRIETWLAVHAPRTAARWNAPAPAAALSALQREVGVELPGDLVATLRRHDGSSAGGFVLPLAYRPMSVGEIAGHTRRMCSGPGQPGWDGRFVPFAVDGGGGLLYLDQRGAGSLGEQFDEGPGPGRWPTGLSELLEQTADLLEEGTGPLADRYRPEVDAGWLRWLIR
ncbi:SMI1/KNR4 family protein [Actinokineospora spheciospongiae]|uniref:SMI1/KNR4 family protein n=1 Tax=Actinokineospora spheciospongiae TaxID=909613 RepID=UPI000D71417A|nr:SMI1/KNR4 family protein [Actinokineospora spheciospongiae]PWW65900.1 hypothetical protein DFQ13_102658 [Actinokineospora spheciospongiae]